MSDLLHIEPEWNEVRLFGEFDRLEVDLFRQAVRKYDGGVVEVDLSGLTFVDLTALRELISARRSNPMLRYVNPTPHMKRLVEITGATEILFGS